MISNSISVRGATIAFVFPTQPELKRDENLRFYDRVTSDGVELPEFQQRPNAIMLRRKTTGAPPNTFSIQVDHFNKQLRFLVSEQFPRRSFELIKQDADVAWDAFQGVWPLERLGGRPVLSEVTIRATAAVDGGNATDYLIDRVLKVSHSALDKLGRKIQGVGLRLIFPVEVHVDQEEPTSSSGADGNLQIETLLDDPSKLFFQLTSKWPTLSLPPGAGPPNAPRDVNVEVRKPSEYFQDVYEFLTGSAVDFLSEAAK